MYGYEGILCWRRILNRKVLLLTYCWVKFLLSRRTRAGYVTNKNIYLRGRLTWSTYFYVVLFLALCTVQIRIRIETANNFEPVLITLSYLVLPTFNIKCLNYDPNYLFRKRSVQSALDILSLISYLKLKLSLHKVFAEFVTRLLFYLKTTSRVVILTLLFSTCFSV